METKLQVRDLRVSFRTSNGKVQAVRGISFDLAKGETLAIVGESGSGKSVTSKAILGIQAANAITESGEIIYDGKDLLKISEEETPEIWKLLRDAKATCENISGFPKYFYKRKRPFMRFQEPTATPQFEPDLRRNYSYPSGHTILGWASALLLTEINPERADTILARGMMYGESRVIVGAHWQSDVDAGRLAAAAAYARMHTSERFLEQMRLAQQEFRCKVLK